MKIVPRDKIIIPTKRQRSDLPTAHVSALKMSILSTVLIQPPVVQTKGEMYELVAGRCRLAAIDSIAADDVHFICNKQMVMPGEVPIIEVAEILARSDVKIIELDENIQREQLSWQDRTHALADIHATRRAENPNQTQTDTARELLASSALAADFKSPSSERSLREAINTALIIAPHLSDPSIAKARNATEAYHLVAQKEEAEYLAILEQRKPKDASGVPTSCSVVQGDLITELPRLEAGTVDLLLCDPPYGIGANTGGFRSRTVHHHNYEDTPEKAKEIVQAIFVEGFRVTRPRANLFMFIDIDLFQWAKEVAKRSGWDVYRTPITWVKSDSEGLAPWGRSGFRRATEWLLFATKGERGLYYPPLDVLRHNRVPRHERVYGPEKPLDLLKVLIECSTMAGDLVLDPCCGSGSTLVASRFTKRKAIGIELVPAAYNLALVNATKPLSELEKGMDLLPVDPNAELENL